jgi:hypothetical protein
LQTLAADSAAFGEQVLKVGSDGVSGGDQGGFDVGIPGILSGIPELNGNFDDFPDFQGASR